MTIFLVAIVVGFVLLLIGRMIVAIYEKIYQDREDELKHSLFFNIAAIFVLIGSAMYWVGITVVLAMIAKHFLF